MESKARGLVGTATHRAHPAHLAPLGRLALLVALTLAILSLAACGGGSDEGTNTTPPALPPSSTLQLTVVPTRASLGIEDRGALAALGTSSAVTWTSSDPAVVRVDADGTITGVARGSATVTASDGTRSASAAVRVWQTSGPGADASSEALIAAARAAARISDEEALVYRVYALFGDERLPTDYQGAPSPQGSVSMREVSGRLPTLSAAAQEILRPFLTPPIYRDSWFGRQLGLAGTVAPAAAGRERALASGSTINCAPEAYMPAGLMTRRSTAHHNLYAFTGTLDPYSGPMLDYAASVVEQIRSALTAVTRRKPKSDVYEPCNGGDGALDIYFMQRLGSENWAETTTYPGRCEDAPAYVIVNSARLGPFFRAGDPASQRILRTVLTHELTHAIQFAMDRKAACADYDWIDEGTAQWAPDHVFPADNQEDGFRKMKLSALRSGVYFADYLLGGHRNAIERDNGYTTYIFFQFVARKYGSAAITALFDAWAGQGSVESLGTAVQAGGGLKEAWPEFGKALWNDTRDNVLNDLRDWDSYDYGMANVVEAKPATLAGGRTTLALLSANGGMLNPRSLAYERLSFPDDVSPVLLSNPLGSLPQSEHLRLTAVKKIGGQWRAPEDWTGELTKYFCRDKVAERIEELLLIVSNSDPDPDAAPVTLPADTPFELSASNVGCWKWQGSATRQIIDDSGLASSEYTARATDLIFEPQIEGPTLLHLAPTAGSARGLFTAQSTNPPCNTTITGPPKDVSPIDGALSFNLDLKSAIVPPDRKVSLLFGTTFIDSTVVTVCNGTTTTAAAPSTGWAWLLYPVTEQGLDVSADGKTIATNFTQTAGSSRTVHNFSFTAMRE